jgi:GNAT superfamily N-acetyltransferase
VLRPYDVQDAPDFLRLLNRARAQNTALESFLAQDAAWPAEAFRQRAVAVHAGTVVGMAELSRFDYLPPGWLRLTLATEESVRGYGVGGRLLAWAMQEAGKAEANGVSLSVLDTDPLSLSWAERQGFRPHAHRFASELDLRGEFPLPTFPAGVTARDMQGASPAEWERLEALFGDLLTQTPDLAGQPRWTPAQLRAHLRDHPRARPDWTLVAVTETDGGPGSWLGVCQGAVISTGIYNEFTGVVPAARGQGIAHALKLELIRRARAAGVPLMRTNNHAANGPMLSVNGRLGFVAQSGSWELHRPLQPTPQDAELA